ncbi:MAG: FtsW/RodA/SpoVE family cell cycle protein, partial [Chloroflexota bacterium]
MTRTAKMSTMPESDFMPRRWGGTFLFLLGGGFMFVSLLSLALERGRFDWQDWVSLPVWIICAVLGGRLINRRLPERERLLFPLAMLMSGWGLVLIERLAPNFADRQVVWLAVSVAALVVIVYVPRVLRLLRAYRYTLLVVGLALLVATIVLGRNPSGLIGAPALWLGIGDFFFQPSEALKIILVVFLASYLAEQYPALRSEGFALDKGRFSPRILGPIALMWGLSVVILIWQRDLGTAILFFMVFLVLLYVASGYTPLLIVGALLVAAAGVVAYNLFDVVQLRVDIWLNPWLEADGRAYQIVQSLLAFAAGGIFGQGIGQGSPTYIPVVHSDFVFAALAEEWGLLGVVAVIACLAVFVVQGLRIAILQRARPFHALLAVGLSMMLAAQSLLIMGGVLKLIPLTGV